MVACALASLGTLAGPAGATTAPNLLRNGGAESGAASLHGWDAVTIPAWSVASGLPTVVRYGDRQFPPGGAGSCSPGERGNRAPGADCGPGASGRRRLRAGSDYALSAKLGGTTTSRAGVSVAFLSARRPRARPRSLGPVGGRRRSAAGALRARCALRPPARAAPRTPA